MNSTNIFSQVNPIVASFPGSPLAPTKIKMESHVLCTRSLLEGGGCSRLLLVRQTVQDGSQGPFCYLIVLQSESMALHD